MVQVWNRRTSIVAVGACVEHASSVEQTDKYCSVGACVEHGSSVEQTDKYCCSWCMCRTWFKCGTDGQVLLQLVHV